MEPRIIAAVIAPRAARVERMVVVLLEDGILFFLMRVVLCELSLGIHDRVMRRTSTSRDSAYLCGGEQEATELGTRAHQGFLRAGEPCAAARCAFWLALGAVNNGDFAQAGGWVARGNRLLENQGDCVEKGYLLVPAAIGFVRAGDIQAAFEAFVEATAIGHRFGDKDLATLAMNGQGRVLVRQGEIVRGLALLDEAMVAVMAGEVSAPIAGAVYCSVIESCHDTFDLRRAQEWTEALNQWCASQPDQVPYRGACCCIVRKYCSSAANGRMHWMKRIVRTSGSRSLHRSRRSARPFIAWLKSLVCAATLRQPKKRTARLASGTGRHSRGSLCCGWRRVRWTRHMRPFAESPTRCESLAADRGFWRLTLRSLSPATMFRRRARPPMS